MRRSMYLILSATESERARDGGQECGSAQCPTTSNFRDELFMAQMPDEGAEIFGRAVLLCALAVGLCSVSARPLEPT